MKESSAQLFFVTTLILVMNSCKSPSSARPDDDSDIPQVEIEVILQEGNSLPQVQLQTRPSNLLATDSRIGTGMGLTQYDLPHWESLLGALVDLGIKRISTSLPEGEEPILWDLPEDEFPQEYDLFIDGLNENGMIVNYVIHFWDKAGHARGESLSTPRFKTAEQIEDFMDYIRLIVGHYKGRIQYYTIWSEPDACGGSGIKCIEPGDYINLIRQVVPVIHEVDSLAKVSIAPNVLYFARSYLFTLLGSDIMPMVDMIQWHGLYDVIPNSEFYGNYYYEYPALIEQIKQTATVHGFDGEYWATEITWTSEEIPAGHAPDQPWEQLKTDKEVAKYFSRAIPMHLGMDVGANLMGFENPDSPWRYPTTQHLNTVMADARPTHLTVSIEGEATNIMSYGFTLADGDKLFTLWTNGVAVGDDPGVITTLTFPGLSAQKVVGIDVLNGFEQQLITSNEDNNLVINGLFVKDYAIIVRFFSPSSP